MPLRGRGYAPGCYAPAPRIPGCATRPLRSAARPTAASSPAPAASETYCFRWVHTRALAPPSRARAPALRFVRSSSFVRLLGASCAGSWPPLRRPSRGRRASLRSLSPPPSLAPRLPTTPALRAPLAPPRPAAEDSRSAHAASFGRPPAHCVCPPRPGSLLPARLPRPPVRARPPSAPPARGLRVLRPR